MNLPAGQLPQEVRQTLLLGRVELVVDAVKVADQRLISAAAECFAQQFDDLRAG